MIANPNDAAVRLLVEDKTSATGQALAAAYVPQNDGGRTALAKLGLGAGTQTWASASDSTGVGPDKWLEQVPGALARNYPQTSVVVKRWNDTTQAYDPDALEQVGIQSKTVALRDEFNRTAADIVGTTPNVGGAWEAPFAASSGDWSLNGSRAMATAETDRQFVLASVGSAGDVEVYADLYMGNPGATGINTALYLKYVDYSNFLQLTVSRTDALHLFSVTKRIGGTYTQILSLTGMVPPPDGLFLVKAQVIGQDVIVTINGVTMRATLTPADVTALAPSVKAGFGSSATAAQGTYVERFEVDRVTRHTAAPVLTLYSGARSGSSLAYQLPRLDALYPVAPDVLIVNSCHNYGTKTPAEYLAELDTFVAAFRAKHPTTGIVVTSQNPEFLPVANHAEHRARNIAIRAHAARRGWGYIAGGEAFGQYVDGGKSLLNSDGLHPTYGGRGSGAALWRDAALDYFTDL